MSSIYLVDTLSGFISEMLPFKFTGGSSSFGISVFVNGKSKNHGLVTAVVISTKKINVLEFNNIAAVLEFKRHLF